MRKARYIFDHYHVKKPVYVSFISRKNSLRFFVIILPKRIHNLAKLAEQAGIESELSDEQKDFLEELTPYNIEARYPSYKQKMASKLSPEYCKSLLERTEEYVCWTKQLLDKSQNPTQTE